MKPIVKSIDELNDSIEIYESKPHRAIVFTIYAVLFLFVIIFVWMYYFKIDIVVKGSGFFESEDPIYSIACGVTGRVLVSNVTNGMEVVPGDILYEISIDNLSETISAYKKMRDDLAERIEMLSIYEASLDDESILDTCQLNKYYKEFCNRRQLLFATIDALYEPNDGEKALYAGEALAIGEAVNSYKDKINNLSLTKKYIIMRSNNGEVPEGVYRTILDAYIDSYEYSETLYDNKIRECNVQIELYNKLIANISNNELKDVSGNLFSEPDVTSYEAQIESLRSSVNIYEVEREKTLSNLEHQQLLSIDQTIEGYQNTLLSLNSSLLTCNLQLEAIKRDTSESITRVHILTEKENIAKEMLTCQSELEKVENNLKGYDIQNSNCIIKADRAGIYYENEEIEEGRYITEGVSLGYVYPKTNSLFTAKVYISSVDIGMIKEGQKVKFEIAAFPSNEYGYFEGSVEHISRNISIDQATGRVFYIVYVKCDKKTLTNKKGEEVSLLNQMDCNAKIIVDNSTILDYVLRKLHFID